MASIQTRLHVVIPTYERPAMLARQSEYIALCTQRGLIKSEEIRITIVDGSTRSSPLRDKLRDLGIRYLHMPHVGLASRISCSLKDDDAHSFIVLGDDDFLDFRNAYGLALQLASSEFIAVAGAFINITGFSSSSRISLSTAERPYSGFSINESLPLSRISTVNALNSVGISSLAYSVQSSSCKDFYLGISGHDFYHGGIEFVHQRWLALHGKIHFSEICHIFRDFTYFNYIPDAIREAPETDPLPYVGDSACKYLATLLAKSAPVKVAEAECLLKEQLILCAMLEKSRLKIFSELDQSATSQISKDMLISKAQVDLVNMAWKNNFHRCYPNLSSIEQLKLHAKSFARRVRRRFSPN